jgi:hypothetical protein
MNEKIKYVQVEVVDINTGDRWHRFAADVVSPMRVWGASEIRKDGQPDARKRGSAIAHWSDCKYQVGHIAFVDEAREVRAADARARVNLLQEQLRQAKKELFEVYAGPQPVSQFVLDYIYAMYAMNPEENYSAADFEPESLKTIEEDCQHFQQEVGETKLAIMWGRHAPRLLFLARNRRINRCWNSDDLALVALAETYGPQHAMRTPAGKLRVF